MAINVSGELFAATSKGKLGSAKQIFLDGDIENVEDKLKSIDSSNGEINSLISELQNTIETLQNTIREVEENSTKIVVLSRAEWLRMKESGEIKEGVFYGVLESDSPLPPHNPDSSVDVTIDEESETIILGGATLEGDTLIIDGEYDEATGTLIIDGTSKPTTGNQTAEIENDNMTLSSAEINDDTLSLIGELDASGEVLTITI